MSDPVAASPSAEALLTRAPLFAGLGRVELARLAAHLEPIDCAPGADVVGQGDVGDSLYVVERGAFAVLLATPASPETRVATLLAGDVFGEMALLTDEPRSATVRADTAGRVLKLARDRFLALLRREPSAFLALATTLSRRLSAGNVAQLESEQYLGVTLARAVDELPPDRRGPWFVPSQTPSYLVAQAASENRLFSHAHAQRFAVAWALLTLLGLALCVPYWRALGLA